MRRTILFSTILLSLLFPTLSRAQQSIVDQINAAGTFDNWSVREIKESGIIGGAYKYLYEFYGSPSDTLRGNQAFVRPNGYHWRTNNVLAIVSGVTKGNVNVFPEKRGDGYCARIENIAESVNATVLKVNVVCQGVLFIGDLPEPIRDMNNPMLKMLYGIPFEGRPSAMVFDYKATVGNPVMYKKKIVEDHAADYPEARVILQKRWVDKNGVTHALRCGTGWVRFTKQQNDWVDGYRLEIRYGDISHDSDFQPWEDLRPEEYSVLNEKGKPVSVPEEGWTDDDPNYLIISFLASCSEAYYGAVGNMLWVDNVKLEM
ncbi:MAG: PCMD domain-containing protein [Bacteroidales bacterium]|nr:PCMD domain-containing protein [Bacteroidales bacterium]